jgi:nucleotide-binding universal stress UspA family protein
MAFTKLLIGFAFSPNLRANIFEATRLAFQFDAEILFLHVGEKTTQKEQEFQQL